MGERCTDHLSHWPLPRHDSGAIEEVLVKDALQGVVDLEQSKGLATLHLMSIATNMDANFKC